MNDSFGIYVLQEGIHDQVTKRKRHNFKQRESTRRRRRDAKLTVIFRTVVRLHILLRLHERKLAREREVLLFPLESRLWPAEQRAGARAEWEGQRTNVLASCAAPNTPAITHIQTPT